MEICDYCGEVYNASEGEISEYVNNDGNVFACNTCVERGIFEEIV
jgi:ribosomal protein L24E